MAGLPRTRAPGVTIPEAYDGAPMDDITESIIVEELAEWIHPSL